MAGLELAALINPISDENPCGPDLDETADNDYLNFMATAEGLVPTSFLVEDEDSSGKILKKPFWERSDGHANIDFSSQLTAAGPLIARTRDLRLITLLAKFSLLDKDLLGFQHCLEAIAALLGKYWDELHPRGVEGDFGLRLAVLGTLDDHDPVILPLRYYPLLEHKNLGTISYRTYLAAAGRSAGTDKIDLVLEKALMQDADLGGLIRVRDALDRMKEALAQIRSACDERLGAGTFTLEALPRLIEEIRSVLERVITARDSAAASVSNVPPLSVVQNRVAAGFEGAPPASAMSLVSTEDAANALAAAIEYFSRSEPSNPALLLARQAKTLIGKSFLEAMQLLLPSQIQNAAVRIGSEVVLDLSLERLAVPPSGVVEASDSDRCPAPASVPSRTPPAAPLIANTRQHAIELLAQVGTYFRSVEPSSPIPLLTDRARGLTGKHFMAILEDVLSKSKE